MARILVVDDCLTTLELLDKRLQMENHEVLQTPSGRQALSLLRGKRFDLVITDVYMPDFDGLQLLSELHADEVRLPIIAISANQLPLDIFAVVRALGAFAAIEKPINFGLLTHSIAAALENRNGVWSRS